MPDPTPLEMIYDKLNTLEDTINRRMDQIISCQIDLKLQDEIVKAKVSSIELKQLQIQEDLDKHRTDMKQHYNPYFEETIPQKLWRKKPEIATGVTLSSVIMAIILKLLEVI